MKIIMMKRIIYLGLIAFSIVLTACEQEKDKVTQLQEYKKELKDLEKKIAELENEIEGSDTITATTKNDKAVLVSTLSVEPEKFQHMIEVRGSVESKRNVLISSETGGKVERVYVKEGQEVKQGQTLIALEADVLRNRIATLRTQLELAETIYKRQAKLWEKNIGTEIQYLEAKNRKETLERELSTAYSQLDQSIIKAPFSGVIDEIPAREGEMMQPGMPVIRLLNPNEMYLDADVSEKYIGRFKTGDKVEIYFPSQGEKLLSEISSVSGVLNKENRTFSVEVQLPKAEFTIKPNQVAVMKLKDYQNEKAITVPTKIIQSDIKGSFVYTLDKVEDHFIARKKHIETGMSFNSKTEVTSGLEIGDLVIDKGITELNDGIQVRLADEKAAEAVRMAFGK